MSTGMQCFCSILYYWEKSKANFLKKEEFSDKFLEKLVYIPDFRQYDLSIS